MGVKRKDIFRDEKGITTVSMAVSIFLSLVLIFSAAQLYRVQSAAADIQEVADVSAMAAEEQVARFMSVANGCDAVIFSMTLISSVATSLGLIAACVPPAAAFSEKLIEAGQRIASARDSFSSAAAQGLNVLQRALPFIAAAKASSIAMKNSGGATGAQYFGAALLIPSTGKPIEVTQDNLSDIVDQAADSAPEIRDKSAEAEAYAQQANEFKTDAFMADCGNYPGKCMKERFEHLAGGSAAENPSYSSPDAWNFKVALDRATSYFTQRANEENPNSFSDVEQRADSVLRKKYYTYATEKLSEAQRVSTAERVDLPELFHNMDGLKQTSLYTEAAYPITQSGEVRQMHAMASCPNASGYTSMGSIADLDAGGFATCDKCKFVPSDLANVGSASTNINNGFQYYYEIVRNACSNYNGVMDQLDPLKSEVELNVGSIFNSIGNLLTNGAGNKRIHSDPPGAGGSIAVVVNTARMPAGTGFESTFVSGGATLGVCAAVSGCSLQVDEDSPDDYMIDDMIDMIGGSAVSGAAGVIVDVWTSLLRSWNSGTASIMGALQEGLNRIPTNSESGLGDWAADAIESMMSGIGLEPPRVFRLRPVTVNTHDVASSDTGSFSVQYLNVQQGALSASSGSTDAVSILADAAHSAVNSSEFLNGTVQVAHIDVSFAGISVPIDITLPTELQESAKGFLDTCIDNVANAVSSVTGDRSWQ